MSGFSVLDQRSPAFLCDTQRRDAYNVYWAACEFTYLLTYGAEPSLRSCQLCSHSGNSQHFQGTRRFIIVFTSTIHWSLSLASSIQSTAPTSISIRSILILSTHLRLGLSSNHFPSGFPTNILYAFLFAPIRAMKNLSIAGVPVESSNPEPTELKSGTLPLVKPVWY
jgi:hypothetical protein